VLRKSRPRSTWARPNTGCRSLPSKCSPKNRRTGKSRPLSLAAGAYAYGASRAGYGTYTTPSGRTGTFYSPTIATIAQNNAAVQNEAIFAATVEKRNMPCCLRNR
jgi:hypothetical protein